jgi:hypothetical protein
MMGDLREEQEQRRKDGRAAGTLWLLWATTVTGWRLRRSLHRPATPPPCGGDGLWQDVRLAFRTWRRQWGLAMVLVVTMTLGIGANTAVFSLANWMIIRPLPGISSPETLVTLREGTPDGAFFTMSVPEFRGLSKLTGLRGLAAHADSSVNVTLPGASRPPRSRHTTSVCWARP